MLVLVLALVLVAVVVVVVAVAVAVVVVLLLHRKGHWRLHLTHGCCSCICNSRNHGAVYFQYMYMNIYHSHSLIGSNSSRDINSNIAATTGVP